VSERPVTVQRQGSWWRYETPWHPALRPYLTGYVGYRDDEHHPMTMRTLPFGSVVVVLSLDEPLHVTAMPDPSFGGARSHAILAGMDDGPGSYTYPGAQTGIQIDLTPLGAYRLLGIPMHRLTNRAFDLADLLGSQGAAVVERLRDTPCWGDRFDLLDAVLLGRMEAGPHPAPEVRECWRRLTSAHGLVPVSELTGEVGWSRKHLAHRFKEQIGLTPKSLARVLRFQRALRILADGKPPFVEVATLCGYYDQAHLIREFRALSGYTPRELLAARAVPGTTLEVLDL
jgi:AraC-like DNA-binding protein